MANHAYASFWVRERAAETMLSRFERLLETFPLSSTWHEFTGFVIRAVSPSEAPLAEHDLHGAMAAASDVIALAREHDSADCSYEVEARWDAWQRNLETGVWEKRPEGVLLICNGADYDDGSWKDSGDFLGDVGFEHLGSWNVFAEGRAHQIVGGQQFIHHPVLRHLGKDEVRPDVIAVDDRPERPAAIELPVDDAEEEQR